MSWNNVQSHVRLRNCYTRPTAKKQNHQLINYLRKNHRSFHNPLSINEHAFAIDAVVRLRIYVSNSDEGWNGDKSLLDGWGLHESLFVFQLDCTSDSRARLFFFHVAFGTRCQWPVPRNWWRSAESILFVLALPPFLLDLSRVCYTRKLVSRRAVCGTPRTGRYSRASCAHCQAFRYLSSFLFIHFPGDLYPWVRDRLLFWIPWYTSLTYAGCTACCGPFWKTLSIRSLCNQHWILLSRFSPSFQHLRRPPFARADAANQKQDSDAINLAWLLRHDVTVSRGCSFTEGPRLAGIRIYRRDEFNRAADNCL